MTQCHLPQRHRQQLLCNYKNGTRKRITLYEDTIPLFSIIDLKPIRGYDKRDFQHHPHQSEPYTMLQVFTNIHDALQEV